MTLDTQNPAFGFYGTIETAGLDAERAWEAAFEAIADAADAHDENAYGPDAVRLFLDSRDGRHFADQVTDYYRQNGGQLGLAIDHAVMTYQRRGTDKATEREYGIPMGLPYITGWVTHHAIEAEMNDA